MQIYCHYEGGLKIRLEGEGIENTVIDGDLSTFQVINFHTNKIFIGQNFYGDPTTVDVAFIIITGNEAYNFDLIRNLTAKVIIPIGRTRSSEGISIATDFASKVMFNKLGVPKVLVEGQYVILG